MAPWRSATIASNAAYSSAADGSNTVAISISPRRRQVVISRRSSGTPAASASRSVCAISDSGGPNRRMIRCSSVPAPSSTARTGSASCAVSHIGCSSRGGPGSTTTTGEPGTTRPGAVPTGSSTVAPGGTIACLRLPARIASSKELLRRASGPAV